MLLEVIAHVGLPDPLCMEPWHPIGTAPKDGSYVHLKFGDSESVGCWFDGEWRNGVGQTFQVASPTLWMRLL